MPRELGREVKKGGRVKEIKSWEIMEGRKRDGL